MKSRLLAGVLTLVTMAALVLPALAEDKYTLRYGMKKGEVYLYSDVGDNKSTQEMMGQEMKSSSLARMISRCVVEDVTGDGTQVLVLSYDSMVVATKSPRMDTTMVMTGMMGKRSRLRLSPTGAISGRETIDSIEVQGMRRSGSFREMQRYHIFPDTAVGIGGTWTTKNLDTTSAMGQKLQTTVNSTYTLNGKESVGGVECLRISHKGDASVEGKGKNMGMEMFIEGKGTLVGNFLFDPLRGLIVSEELKSDMDMTVALTGQQNMTIPMTQSTVYTRTLITK